MKGAPELLARPPLRGVPVQHAQHGYPQGSKASPEVRGEPLAFPWQLRLAPQLPLHLHHSRRTSITVNLEVSGIRVCGIHWRREKAASMEALSVRRRVAWKRVA